ncbi:hypothetical protein D1007_04060 [Hordeum vulgare]|nr:hypothetical protein D1007_04060 [Hordeum vulgare]
MKAKPQETSERYRIRGGNLVINESRQPSAPRGHLRLVRTKKESVTPLIIKQENIEMATDLDTGLKCPHDDYVREEMERKRRAVEKIDAWRRDHEEDDIIVLSDSDKETPAQAAPVRSGDPGQGCSKDDGARDGADGNGDDDDDDDGDYTAFYELLGMN